MGDGGDVGDAQGAPGGQHDSHGDDWPPGPPENACTAVGEGQEEVEQADGPGVGHAVGDDLRAAVEGGNQQGREDEDAQPDGLGQQGTAQQPEPDAGADPVIAPRPDVLAYKGGQGHGKAGDRQKGKALDFAVGTAARHGRRAEGVDVGLDDDVGQGDDRVLNAGGNTQIDDLPKHIAVKAYLPPGQAVAVPGVGELAESQEGAEGLAEDGGQSRAGHAPAEDGHEQQIQYHVGEGGENQILHGTAAVPHRLEDAGAHVVEHYGAGA